MSRQALRPYYLLGGLIALCLAITAAAGLLVKGIYQPFMSEGLVAAQYIQDFVSVVLGMTLLFVPIWLGMMAQDIAAQKARATATVFVLDLAFLIPACTVAAVQFWRRRPWGYLLGGILLIKATVSGLLLSLTSLRGWQLGLGLAMEELGMYLFLAVAGLVGLALYMRDVK